MAAKVIQDSRKTNNCSWNRPPSTCTNETSQCTCGSLLAKRTYEVGVHLRFIRLVLCLCSPFLCFWHSNVLLMCLGDLH